MRHLVPFLLGFPPSPFQHIPRNVPPSETHGDRQGQHHTAEEDGEGRNDNFLGDAELATAEKGREAYEEAVKQLVRFVTWFQKRPKDRRRDLHRKPPTMPIPWGQTQ